MRNQRGNGRLGLIIWLAVIGAAIFGAVQIIPAKITVYEFHDYVDRQAQFAASASGKFDEKKIRNNVLQKAAELGLPLNKKQVKVRRTKGRMTIDLQHTVEVDLKVYTWVWEYDRKFEHLRI